MTVPARLRVALIGAGVMGENHARVLTQCPSTELGLVIDPDGDRAARVADRYGTMATDDLSAASTCDAAVVASPTETHAEIAMALLIDQIPLLIEKPLGQDVAEVRQVLETARNHGVPLMCGFVERFNPAVVTGVGLLEQPAVHLLSVRHSPPNRQISTGVIHDLLIHDIDLVTRICESETVSVRANAWRRRKDGMPQIVDTLLAFSSGALATLSADRWAQRKLRTLSISTETELVEIDLLRQDVTVYRHVSQGLLAEGVYRSQTVIDVPFVKHAGEPLYLQLEHFVNLLRGLVDVTAETQGILGSHLIAAEVERLTTRATG